MSQETANYYVLTNGKVYAPIESKWEEAQRWGSGDAGESVYYETKSGCLCHKYSYPTDIDFDDDLGKPAYCDYKTEREYLGKIKARFNNIYELVEYLRKEN